MLINAISSARGSGHNTAKRDAAVTQVKELMTYGAGRAAASGAGGPLLVWICQDIPPSLASPAASWAAPSP